MCTVSFIAREQGYLLGMNRDEKWDRPVGLEPEVHRIEGRSVVFPAEPAGGTWISLGGTGVCFALINWYAVASTVNRSETISRGQVVRALATAETTGEAIERLEALQLERMNPFRLIGIFRSAREVMEWRWNGARLERVNHSWEKRQWISSGYDEETAQRVRGETFEKACTGPGVGTIQWLRRLHGSHEPQRGAFSTCVHRADAGTVSYTEIDVSENEGVMRYHDGPPCELGGERIFQPEHRLKLPPVLVI